MVTPPVVAACLSPAFAHQWLPAGLYCVVDLRGDVRAGVFAGAAAVAVDGVGGDPDLARDGAGAAELLEQEADLALEGLGRLAGEALAVGAFDGVVDLPHDAYSPSSRTASPPLMWRAGL